MRRARRFNFRCIIRTDRGQRPELRLAVAILRDAADCFQNYLFADDCVERRLFEEAESWIMSRDCSAFSFEHLCEVTGLNAVELRRSLQHWKNEQSLEKNAC